MKMRHIAMILFFFLSAIRPDSIAQTKENIYNHDDTLTQNEEQELNAAIRQNTFGFFGLADSCSKKEDSISAGSYFLKVDPYILFFDGVTPESIDSFLIDYFKLTAEARKKYDDLFIKTYNEPKTLVYDRFMKMGEEDRLVRRSLEKCKDTICAAVWGEKMQHTDSIHAAILYNYVKKNGWPSLAKGSMYASLIAIHDHNHHNEYIPYLKEAVKKGDAEMSALSLIVYWNAHANDYSKKLKDYIKRGKYFAIDVSSMLVNKPVSNSIENKIISIVQKHCPVKFLYIIECHDEKAAQPWNSKSMIIPRQMNVLSLLMEDLAHYDCNISHTDTLALQTGCWASYWQPSDHKDVRMILYILYDRTDTIYNSFNKINIDKHFVTHAINFDINKSTIKPECSDFINQLAIWLSQNSTVKLEINGHTDNDGNPSVNLILSQARADEVKKQLVTLGVDSSRLTTKGYGDTKPIQPNTTPEGKANNRRVEFIKQ